jgi:hypothetical protein
MLVPRAARGVAAQAWNEGDVRVDVLRDIDAIRTVAEYASKTFTLPVGHGRHRYSAARGFHPERVRLETASEGDAYLALVALHGGVVPEWTSRSEDLEGWSGPPVWQLRWSERAHNWQQTLEVLREEGIVR